MEHFVITASAARYKTDCAIVGVFEKGVLTAAAGDLDERLGGAITRLVDGGDLRGKLGETLLLADLKNSPCKRIVLVGLGTRDQFARKQYRRALSAAIALTAKTGAKDAVNYLSLER